MVLWTERGENGEMRTGEGRGQVQGPQNLGPVGKLEMGPKLGVGGDGDGNELASRKIDSRALQLSYVHCD